ncbi:unnamed protein product, partial [marine sediment metagenome]
PTADQDAATRAYVLGRVALRLALTGGTMSGNIIMGGHKVTGLGQPLVQDQALRYSRAEIRNNEIAAAAAIAYSKLNLTGAVKAADIEAAAGIPLTKLEAAVCSETEAATLIANGDVDKLDGFHASELAQLATALLFQANAATGPMVLVSLINDNDTGNAATADAIDEYGEVDFISATLIKRWRQFGTTNNDGVGRWKLQYWDGDAWQDWETDIPTRTTANLVSSLPQSG